MAAHSGQDMQTFTTRTHLAKSDAIVLNTNAAF
jgi:hypothetical protein